ncbi:MAG TPA: dihydrodipicolinate synthase family protein [Burkholderiales bacterium]|nr:dihydrodipicolinate synthase family protein [Burkholderiales bacterium]
MSTVLSERKTTAATTARRKAIVLKGVMQAPVTPLKDDFSFDAPGFEKMVDFHVRHGAPAIAWPHHKAESLNLTIAERKLGAEIAVNTVAGRVPVSIFTGTLSEEDSLDIARHAEKAGADAVLTISPYCRRPSQNEIYDSIVRIGMATDLPVLTYNSPWRNGEEVEFTGELTQRLIERLPNYIGMKDASFHSRKFLEISRVALRMRPGFAIIMGVEHLLASYPLGACGSFSSSGAIAPRLCNRFFAALEAHDWATARECQYKISRLWRLFKEQYPSSLKGAMIMMGRPVGPVRSPLPTATPERIAFLRSQLEELDILQTEPHGW